MIDERRVCVIDDGDVAPDPLRCEFTVYLPLNRDLWTHPEPEMHLRRVDFFDGSYAEKASDYARLVSLRFNDPQWLRYLPWEDVERRCQESYYRNTTSLLPRSVKEAA